MAAPFNYQIFQNVATKEDFLTNIKTVASDNGWTIDKDDISANAELYLHSTGNGSQNLYYSIKAQLVNAADSIYICANTGFDTGSAWDAQPGKFNSYRVSKSSCAIFYPLTQYVLVENSNVLCFWDDIDLYSGRILGSLYFGAIDSYKVNETEGNMCLVYYASNYVNKNFRGSVLSGLYYFGHNYYGYNYPAINALLYNGIDRIGDTTNLGSFYKGIGDDNQKTSFSINKWTYNSGSSAASVTYNGYQYNYAVQYNDWASRNSLIKPIVSIADSDATNTYFYPIGELPYYACKAYPYTKAGDIVDYGTRKFMVFPLLNYTDGDGVAIEVNG